MKRWSVDVAIDEHDNVTRAEARLTPGDGVALRARGTARRNPGDPSVPGIGDELAVARALAELAHRLLHAASNDIESVTHEHADLSG
ncbi:MAG TPA: DUF1876 domain-containing protein [Mycobacteriales bacterium]|nr:DUF1876 domain-containing protein [Mycobacteriales bacterium]